MRLIAAFMAAAVVVGWAAPAHAGTVDVLTVPSTVSKADGALTVSGEASFAAAGRQQVFADGTGDDVLLLEATPPAQDLVAGYVEVDHADGAISFTWQVAELPDIGGVPEAIRYLWDFTIASPAQPEGAAPEHFSIQAKFTNVLDRTGPQTSIPAGKLQGRCTRTENVITCQNLGEVPVAMDAAENTITATVPFSMLADRDGTNLAVPGAVIAEDQGRFIGIAAILQAAVSSAAMGDQADADPFALGDYVQLGLTGPLLGAEIPDEFLALTEFVVPDAAGAFTHSFDISNPTFPAGDYVVAARACTDAACGPLSKAAVDITE